MFFPSKMKQVSLITHDAYLEPLVTAIHESGLLQIIDIHREMPQLLENLEKASMHPDAGECATHELRLTRVITILSRFSPREKGIKALLNPKFVKKKRVYPRPLQKIFEDSTDILAKTEEMVVNSEDQMRTLDVHLKELDEKIQIVNLLSPFNLDVSWVGESKYLQIWAGISPNLNSLQKALENKEVTILSKEKKQGKERIWTALLIAHKSTNLGKEYKQFFEEFNTQGMKGYPTVLLEQFSKEKEKIDQEKKGIISSLKEFHDFYIHDLLAIKEEIILEKVRKEILIKFAKTHQVYFIEGWVLARNTLKLETLVNEATEGYAQVTFMDPPPDPDGVPVHLEMPHWAKPFKSLLELFALPRYNEVNPTIIIGIFFILFFAFMLGDAGYGSLLLIFSLFGYLKLGKHSPFIREWSSVGICLGVLTIITGLMFNGFFGDLIPRFIYGDSKALLYHWGPFPIDALHKPVIIFVMALILGLIHLNLGILMGLYKNLKNRWYGTIVKNQAPWFFLQIGGGSLVGSSMLKLWELSGTGTVIASVFAGIGILGLIRKSGALSLFDITGFTGDWLSYARLLALGLSTAGMALAFNIVADVFSQIVPFIGIIMLLIILLIGHFVNFILQSLGAAIHSLRLQYVEFFNRFYEGGGKEFIVFKIERKYTEVKE